MSKEMIINTSPQETKVAILEDDQLVEVHIERSLEQGLVGSIYKGRVTKVLPGMQSAFVNVGLERDAFLYVSDFFEDAEEYDSIVATVEDKIEKLESSPGEAVLHAPSPMVIEIPTRLDPSEPQGPPSAALPGVKALQDKVPPIAQAAVLAQPTPVSEKVLEARRDLEKGAAAATDQGSSESTQKAQGDMDRQSRGRYGRRRGRRRPWERRKEEPSRSLPQPPVQPQTSTPAVVATPPAPPVVSTLTPLPGESLSKFQQSPSVSVEEQPQAHDLEPLELAALPATAAASPEGVTEAPQVTPPGPVPAETQEATKSPTSGQAVGMSWVQEAPLIPNQPETFEQVERILSMLDVQGESVQPPTKLEPPPLPPADSLETDSIIPLDVIVPDTPVPVSPTVTEAAASVSEPVELTEEPIPLLLEESEPSDDSTISASINTTDSAAMVREAPQRASDMPEAIDAWREPVEPVSPEPANPMGSGSAPAIPTSEVHDGPMPLDGQAPARQEESKELEPLPLATATSEPSISEGERVVEQPGISFGAISPEPDMLSMPEPETGETLAAALPHFESPKQFDEARFPVPEQSVPEERSVEASIMPPEPAEQIPETPPVAGLNFQGTGPETRLPEVPPVATPVVMEGPASLPTAASRPPFKEEAKRERGESRFERSSTSKFSPAARRFEAKGGKAAAPLAPQPEVYGPPTPYEYMTDVEKAEYNARRAQEKTSAKILDSSRKLTAPQPRDFGFQRGRRGRRGRNKRFADHETPSEQPAPREEKRPSARPLIADLLREGQEILVQIAKEPLGKKGARITSHIALPGRYLVYMPTVDHIGVSRKIGSDEERRRLKRIINEFGEGLPGGFIVRTAGEGRTEEELKQDIRFLANTWTDIRSRAEKRAAPALLHRDLGVLERILRDQLSSEFTAIRLDTETEYAKVLEFVNQFQPALVGRVKLHFKDTPIFEEYGVDHEIEKALKPKVWLKSGGYIVINQTEAMVAIDVNTGKFVGKTTRLEDTIVKTNIDAAKEVARQIRLRDMGGIIVIDFIDMEERKNRQKVIQALEEAMRQDRAPSKILSFNDFGLVALTRKRVKQSLEKILMQPCVYCQGHGLVKSVQTVCYEIQAEAKKMAPLLDGREIRIRVHPEVARALKTTEQTVVSEIESHTRKDVMIKPDPQTHQDQFEIF